MGLIEFIVLAVVLGMLAWVIQQYTPIPQPIKTLIVVVICVVLVLILVRGMVGDVSIPRLR